jgi:excisionase family DNA binding protein
VILNADQAAELLHCAPDTVRRLASSGEIPGRKLGRRWLFEVEQLRAYVRGEWHSTNDRPAALGGLDSQYAVALFGAPATPRTDSLLRSTRRPFVIASGGRRISASPSTPGAKPSSD